jgi:hypothetical protein
MDIDGTTGEVLLKFLRCRGNHYTWPEQEDISWVTANQIVCHMENPDISGREQFCFSK